MLLKLFLKLPLPVQGGVGVSSQLLAIVRFLTGVRPKTNCVFFLKYLTRFQPSATQFCDFFLAKNCRKWPKKDNKLPINGQTMARHFYPRSSQLLTIFFKPGSGPPLRTFVIFFITKNIYTYERLGPYRGGGG